MTVPRTGGNFASETFIPELFSMRLLDKFYAETCLNAVANTNYQEEMLHKGQLIHIRQRPTVSLQDYTRNEDISYTDVDASELTFTIDYAKLAAVKFDIVDSHQQDINVMAEVEADINHQVRIEMEKRVFGAIPASAGIQLTASAFTDWKTNPIDYLLRADTSLTEGLAPRDKRWMVIHPRMKEALLKQAALYSYASGASEGALQAGFVKRLLDFDIYESLHVPGSGTAGDPYLAVFGHYSSLTLATQFTEAQLIPFSDRFLGKAIRVLNVYGFKVVKPEIMGCLPSIVA